MLFRGSLIAQASGSVAGNTFSRNRGGQYIRNRATPVNPQTAQQVAVRNAFSQLTVAWGQTLTDTQRAAWDNYAANVPVLNALGDSIFLTGFNMYVRSNTPRLQAGLTRVDSGPTTFDLGTFTPVTVAFKVTGGFEEVTFTNGDAWANENDSSMLVYGSRSLSPTINFFKGPFRLAGTIDGDGTTAPTSPAETTSPFTIVIGNAYYARVRVSRADGRLSSEQIIRAIGELG